MKPLAFAILLSVALPFLLLGTELMGIQSHERSSIERLTDEKPSKSQTQTRVIQSLETFTSEDIIYDLERTELTFDSTYGMENTEFAIDYRDVETSSLQLLSSETVTLDFDLRN